MRLLQKFLSRGISRPLLQRYLPSSALRQQQHASTWAPATAAVHADAGIDKTSHDSDVAPPIGLSTTFDDGADHVYSRISAPTRERCEAVLAALEGGDGARAVLFASGNAATHAVLASLAARAREASRRETLAHVREKGHMLLGQEENPDVLLYDADADELYELISNQIVMFASEIERDSEECWKRQFG